MKKKRILLWICLCFAALMIAASSYVVVSSILLQRAPEVTPESRREVFHPRTEEETVSEEIPEDEDPYGSTLGFLTRSAGDTKEALDKRPPTVDVDPSEISTFVTIDSCLISGKDEITIKASSNGIPRSDDKYYYLFELPIYEDAPASDASPVTRVYKDAEVSLSLPLNRNSADSRLYRRFFLATKENDAYVRVSGASFVTNPEYLAPYSYGGMSHSSKKGLLVDPFKTAELTDLGVQYATYNIPLNRILTTSTQGSVSYSYCGVTYHFNAAILGEYDHLFQVLNGKGIDIAAIVLNNASVPAYPEITHPDARSGSTAPYNMMNASDRPGVQALSAVFSFLASRYSGSGHGNVSMWIVGNEVNARKEWNYMAHTDLSTYTRAYTDSFRIAYNAIKSVNSAAKVYVPFDQQWDRNRKSNPDYDARDMLDLFASSLRACGDIDWGLAEHPYSYPNNNTPFWKSSSLVTHSYDTSILTMDNIEVLTGYMEQEALLAPDGSVRSIILSEMGYSSTSGEALQAAAFAYAYTKIEKEQHIDAMMLSRQTDASEEIAAFGLALGLSTTGGRHKQIYEVFKYIDTSRSAEVTAFAKNITGVDF